MDFNFYQVKLPDGKTVEELRVIDLKNELEKRGLTKSGNKQDLSRRLGMFIARSTGLIADDITSTSLDTTLLSVSATEVSSTTLENSISAPEDSADFVKSEELKQESILNDEDAELVTSSHVKAETFDEVPPVPVTEMEMEEIEEETRKIVDEMNEDKPEAGPLSQSSVRSPVDELGVEMLQGDDASDLDFDETDELAVSQRHESPQKVVSPKQENHTSDKKDGTLEEGEVDHSPGKSGLKRVHHESTSPSHRDVNEGNEEPVKRIRLSPPRTQPQINKITLDNEPTDASTSGTGTWKRKGLKDTVVVGHQVEKPERLQPSQPVTTPISNIVNIRHLVRPFTANQLKEMLQQFGTVKDLWMDRIKSKAYAIFEAEEDAAKCREELDGCRWPSINPKSLRTDYASQEEYSWMVQNGDSGKPVPRTFRPSKAADSVPSATTATTPVASASAPLNNGVSKPEGAQAPPFSGKLTGGLLITVTDDKNKPSQKVAPRKMSVGEDGDTSEIKANKEKPKEEQKERDTAPRRRSRSRERVREKVQTQQLTDLFRKTNTVPAIYWNIVEDAVIKERRENWDKVGSVNPNRKSPPSSSRLHSDYPSYKQRR